MNQIFEDIMKKLEKELDEKRYRRYLYRCQSCHALW